MGKQQSLSHKTTGPKQKSAAAGIKKRDPNALVNRLPKGKTEDQGTADLIVEGVALNALAVKTWAAPLIKGSNETDIDVTSLVLALDDTVGRVHGGSLADAEALLVSQAVVLNAIFVHLAQLGKQATLLDHYEKHMRLAFKAQGQCRATLETLAVLKNPPVFARQANISSGPQQVNNGPVLNAASARAEPESAPNKLLEAIVDGERVDGRTEGSASTSDSAVATVATFDGTADATGKSARIAQRLPRRRAGERSRTR